MAHFRLAGNGEVQVQLCWPSPSPGTIMSVEVTIEWDPSVVSIDPGTIRNGWHYANQPFLAMPSGWKLNPKSTFVGLDGLVFDPEAGSLSGTLTTAPHASMEGALVEMELSRGNGLAVVLVIPVTLLVGGTAPPELTVGWPRIVSAEVNGGDVPLAAPVTRGWPSLFYPCPPDH